MLSQKGWSVLCGCCVAVTVLFLFHLGLFDSSQVEPQRPLEGPVSCTARDIQCLETALSNARATVAEGKAPPSAPSSAALQRKLRQLREVGSSGPGVPVEREAYGGP